MGSYLSIVNDTADTFHCNVGDDQAALKISGIILAVVGALASIVSAGAATPAVAVFLGASGTVGTISIASTAAAVSVISSATVLGHASTAAGLLQTIVEESKAKWEEKGYFEIPPGGRRQYGKMSLSLWRQGHCVRYRSTSVAMQFTSDEVFMRPIFSGATDNSNIDHSIRFWIGKAGYENEKTIKVAPPPDKGGSWGDVYKPFGGPQVKQPCGNGVVGNGICPNNLCCSKWGWCDKSPDHCGGGTCGNGKRGDGLCANRKLCCSKWGWCDSSAAHCN